MTTHFAKLIALIGVLFLHLAEARAGILNWVYHSEADVPLPQGGGFDANQVTVNFTLDFAPPVGTNLTVVNMMNPLFQVNGTFANLAQNQAVTLDYGGVPYNFVANYFGGTGNDVVLQWAGARAMGWGSNGSGQIGNNTTGTSSPPVAVTASGALTGKTIVALAAGRNHSLALCSDGTVAAWGLNANGQIGPNGGAQSNVPVLVSGLGVLATRRVIAIAAGETHNLALCSDGRVAAWGFNGSGRLGNGTTTSSATPVLVTSAAEGIAGRKVIAIAAGQSHSMALLVDGKVVTWGDDFYGQLGNGAAGGSTVPVLVDTLGLPLDKTATAIAAGENFCMALCSGGQIATWGENKDGQIGDGTTTQRNSPVSVTVAATPLASRTVTSIAAGSIHSLALCSDGTVAAWGGGTFGQLGNGASASSSLAVPVNATGALLGKIVKSIASGSTHSLAQCSDGTLTAWGSNGFGQTGTGTSSPVPLKVSTTALLAGERFTAAAGGPSALHSLAIVASPAPPGSLTAGTLISNGSFENGSANGFTNWSISDINSSTNWVPLQRRDNGFNPFGMFSTAATDGIFSASSGFSGDAPGIVRLAHDVAVTAGEPFVRFDYRAGWNLLGYSSAYPARTFAVTIEPAGGGTVLRRTVILSVASGTRNLDTGPLTGAVDLSAFVGTTVRVCFDLTVPEPTGGPAFFQLDNVRTAAPLPATVHPITGAATGLTTAGATLNGVANANGGVATVQFEFGPTTSYGSVINTAPTHATGNTDTPVSATLTGLDAKTTYHYRVKTVNGGVADYGADATFTPLPHAPAISALGLSGKSSSSASLYAGLNADESSTVVTFEYGLTADCTSSTPAWESPNTIFNGGAHAQISGLTGGTTYYYRIRAQNAGGVTVSDPPLTFDTLSSQTGDPAVRTLGPTMVDRFSARLNGSVQAGGAGPNAGPAFLLPTMHNTAAGTETFGMSYTADDFATVTDFAIGDLAAAPGKGLRDPCLFRANGKWYCFCTLDAWSIGSPYPNQNQFRILTSTNLTTWTTLADVTVPGATQFTWAPKAFYDARSNRLYVALSHDRNPGVGAHDPTLAYASLDDLTSWSGWTTVTSLIPNAPDVFWDFQLSTDGVYYYAIGVTSGAAPSMKIYRSDSIDSGYTLFSTFDFGGGQFAEQCWLEFLGGTNWEIYYCKPQLRKIYRRTSGDGMGTWSTEQLILDYTASGRAFACPFRLPRELTPASSTSPSASVSFDFGTTTQYTSGIGALPSTVSGGMETPVSGTRYGLSPGTTYHYRTRAFGPNGYVYGPDVTFTTPAIGFPAASTDKVLNITQTTAVLSGFASANNGPQTTMTFDYGTDTNYGGTVTLPGFAPGNSLGFVHTQIPVSGDGITYHYRIRAVNNIGTTYGQDMTFTTPAIHEARLYDLVLNGASLFPAFDRDLTGYVMSLPFRTANLSVAPTASTGIASVMVNGISVPSGSNSDPIALNIGSNVITITVTALDGVTQQTYTVTITRAAPVPGDLDLSFNGTGMLTTDFDIRVDTANAMAMQSDGRIVVVGGVYNVDNYDFAIARYNPDGSLDTTFNGTGKVVTDIAGKGEMATSVALQSDGKILVAGNSYDGSQNNVAVLRYNADGTLDTTFNGTGKVVTLVGTGDSNAASVAVQGDGKIVVAGSAQNGGTDNDFALVRYHGDIATGAPGTLDTTFNGTGTVITPMGTGDDNIISMALQANGMIVVAGYSNNTGSIDCAMARYTPNGSLDTTFNSTGKIATSLSGTGDDVFNSVAVQGDGKIVAAGYAYNGTDYDFAVVRYHGDSATGAPGTLDTTFNGTGKVITPIGAGDDTISGMALQSDGKIVVAGRSFDGSNHVCTVARYTSGGILDTTFRGTGTTSVDFGFGSETVSGMALQGDGKIVVAGWVNTNFQDFAIARFLGDGPAIAVQAGAGPNVFDGISSVQFPGALPGVSTSVTFTIQNTGTANLTGLDITLDGTDTSAFTVTADPAAPVSPFGTTTFTVRFLPASLGLKSAALHIASNVTGQTKSYDIALTGSGLTRLENWRQQFFGSAGNTGDAADDADPNANGISNLLEYALKGDPAGNTTDAGVLPQPFTSTSSFYGDRLQLEFTSYADRTDITLIVQGADSPAGPWSDLATNVNAGGWTSVAPGAVVTQLVIPFVDPVAFIVRVFDPYQINDPAHPSRFMRLKVTSP